MEVRKAYTPTEFKQMVEQLKAEGHIFFGYTWNHACFNDIVVERCYED